METKSLTKEQIATAIFVFIILTAAVIFLYFNIGLPPVIIIGIPGIAAYILWITTYLKNPTAPAIILPLFLITAAGFEFHLVEEYLGHYAPAISRIFNIDWTDKSFLIISLILSGGLSLIAVGLYYRKPIAGFIAILFLFTRLAEIGLFIFPLLSPALQPQTNGFISQYITGGLVTDTPNYYFYTVGKYYFPGMYSVALPMIPAIIGLYKIWKNRLNPPGSSSIHI